MILYMCNMMLNHWEEDLRTMFARQMSYLFWPALYQRSGIAVSRIWDYRHRLTEMIEREMYSDEYFAKGIENQSETFFLMIFERHTIEKVI